MFILETNYTGNIFIGDLPFQISVTYIGNEYCIIIPTTTDIVDFIVYVFVTITASSPDLLQINGVAKRTIPGYFREGDR